MPRFLLSALLAVGLAACQTPTPNATNAPATPVQTVSAADPAAVRAEIEAMSARYQAAARAGDAAAIQALHADDAVLHPAGEPAVRGRAAVDAFLAADHAEPVDLTFTTVEVVASGELAYEMGTVAGPRGPGKYLTVYRRTPDGWRIAADTWSDDEPTAAAPAN